MYQAWVRVRSAECCYWNKLGPLHDTHAAAEAEVKAYAKHKREGTGGFRKGAPEVCKITREDGKWIEMH